MHSCVGIFRPLWLLMTAGLFALSACVNQAGTSDPYRLFSITEDQNLKARQKGVPYVVNKRGNLRTIEPIDYQTEQFGSVRIQTGFISDGSSLPFDKNTASIMASLLHDAMYRGAPQLRFIDGYPGRWTKVQADNAYCLQLQRLGAPERLATINCRGVRFLSGNLSVWSFHKERRERYWSKHGSNSQI